MRTIAHLVKPSLVEPGSDLVVAQPITFQSLRHAKALAQNSVSVELLTTQYPEDRPLCPRDFRPVPDLTRSVTDMAPLKENRKLPLLRDVLARLHDHSEATYLIYSNVDIAVMPHFYLLVDRVLDRGADALVINRRTISSEWEDVADLPLMCAEYGRSHPGYDCFVFHRNLYRRLVLGDVCLGSGHVDLPLICSLIAFASRFVLLDEAHATFHIGDRRAWAHWKHWDCLRWNDRQASQALKILAESLPRPPRLSFLYHAMRWCAVPWNPLFVSEWRRACGQ